MPQMGYDMNEGTLVRWLKSEGSYVNIGDPIVEIETDKAVVEFESYASGVLHKILAVEGAVVPVGAPIAIVGDEDEMPAEDIVVLDMPPPAPEETPVTIASQEVIVPQDDVQEEAGPREIRASPVARKLADEHGIDLSQLIGTGPGGRITKGDVEKIASSLPPTTGRPASASEEVTPLSSMRRQIARVTVHSKQEKPHFYVASEIDMTSAMELRAKINEALEVDGIRVTVNDLIIRACVEALKKYPKFNAFLQEDGIHINQKINVGVAIAEQEGLIVPAIIDCADRSLRDIAAASKDLSERAQNGRLSSGEYTDGTFAISNLGMFDVSSFIAIIHPPQTAVLAVGNVAKRPVVKDNRVEIAQMMTATLSADHRIVDGAEGARFIVEIKRLLENPLSFLI